MMISRASAPSALVSEAHKIRVLKIWISMNGDCEHIITFKENILRAVACVVINIEDSSGPFR